MFGLLAVLMSPSAAQDTDQEKTTALFWDEDGDPGKYDQVDLPQYKRTCGDDANEYLIREHSGSKDEITPGVEDRNSNVWVCADRPTDCAYDGKVYSEGQFKDVSQNRNENGINSPDQEVCLDTDPDIPGGEWNDVDKASINSQLPNSQTGYLRQRTGGYSGDGAVWFKNDYGPVKEAINSPFSPLSSSDITNGNQVGYALEDDVGPDINADDTSGTNARKQGQFVYSFFTHPTGDDGNAGDDVGAGSSFSGASVRMKVSGDGSSIETGHGSTTTQDRESVAPDSDFTGLGTSVPVNDSTIDPREDTWALADSVQKAVGPTGAVYSTGQCYGGLASNQGNNRITKDNTVMANSYAAEISGEGVWTDPDETVSSAGRGGVTCDLNANDWGYGFNTGSGLTAHSGQPRDEVSGISGFGTHSVSGDIKFDEENNLAGAQTDLQQYPDACGDDRNEYLIREHDSKDSVSEFDPDLNRNNIYVCADRPTDCAYNGKVYSQGQLKDVASETSGEEKGNQVNDPEICLDVDNEVPGGEWVDIDNEFLRSDSYTSELSNSQWQDVSNAAFRSSNFYDTNPGTDRNVNDLGEFTVTDSGTSSFDATTYSGFLEGYATEDDCDPDLEACSDEQSNLYGNKQQINGVWFNAGNFSTSDPDNEGSKQDNTPQYNGVHNKMQDSSDQLEPSSSTSASFSDTYGTSTTINDSFDSTPGPDNWTISDTLTDSVSNDGRSLATGKCHYRDSGDERTEVSDNSVNKKQKYFGNSYADTRDVDGDGTNEGVWEDPDDFTESEASKTSFSCDLTRDRGMGYDKPSEDKYKTSEQRTYIGDIAFQGGDNDPAKGLEHPVCGDDRNEYFIETVGSPASSPAGDGPYACTNSFDFCVEPNPSGPELFQTGAYTNVDEPRETKGRFKQDDEICLNPGSGRTGDTLHGVWYDQDFGDVDGDGDQETCDTNTLYGAPGVRWFSEEDVIDHPYAVRGGIDDDYNQFLEDEGVTIRDSNATLDDTQDPEFDTSTESPVGSGTNTSKLATLGFCGGDDGSEYLASQVCRTDICVSDRSHLGVAKEPNSCVYDGRDIYTDVPQPVDGDKHKRMLYNPGDQIALGYERQQTITCVDGQWFEKGPIVFDRSQKNISLGSDATASFRVINLGALETEYEVTLNKETEAEKFSTIEDEQSPSFNVDVPPKESRNFEVRIRGIRESLEDSEDSITVTAEAVNADKEGSDSLEISTVDENQAGSQRQADEEDQDRNVPGITAIEILLLLMLSTALYTRI